MFTTPDLCPLAFCILIPCFVLLPRKFSCFVQHKTGWAESGFGWPSSQKPIVTRIAPHLIISAGPSLHMSYPENTPSWATQHFISFPFWWVTNFCQPHALDLRRPTTQSQTQNNMLLLCFGLWPNHLLVDYFKNPNSSHNKQSCYMDYFGDRMGPKTDWSNPK